ncbi:MAG: hypothetical protein WCI93_00960 [bacterium]
MSKRNIILIAIVLIIGALSFSFYYFYKPVGTGTGDTTGTNFFSDFFPFGKSTTTNTGTTNNPADVSGYIPAETGVTPKELLTKISSMPIAGYGIFLKERFVDVPVPEAAPVLDTTKVIEPTKTIPVAPTTEFAPSVRYVERATGNVFQTFADKIYEQKFTNTVIPAVYDAYFGDNGNSVTMRYLKDENIIESFTGTMPKEILGADTSIGNELTGSFLPENITNINISPDKASIFYLFNTQNGSVGVTSSSAGDKKNQTFTSSFSEWLSEWPNQRMITLTTKPSFGVAGFMYAIDPVTKKMNKILDGVNGLTTLTSPSGKLVLYNDNSLALRIYDISTGDSTSAGIKTMSEKCTWNKTSTIIYCAVPNYVSGNNYPDIWYQGETSFSDDLWKINVETGSASNIADPLSFTRGEDIDGIKLSLDDNENYLFFVNKKDSYLWELKIN